MSKMIAVCGSPESGKTAYTAQRTEALIGGDIGAVFPCTRDSRG